MSFVDIHQFTQTQLAEIAQGQLEQPLARVSQMAYEVSSHPRALSKVIASPELDEVCRAAGQAMLPNLTRQGRAVNDDVWLFVATYLYDQGGHTRVLEDYIKFADGKKCIVLLTNPANGDPIIHKGDLYTDEVERLGASVGFCVGGNMVEKLNGLKQKIVDLSLVGVFLLNTF